MTSIISSHPEEIQIQSWGGAGVKPWDSTHAPGRGILREKLEVQRPGVGKEQVYWNNRKETSWMLVTCTSNPSY
jgi:hypothetical protein